MPSRWRSLTVVRVDLKVDLHRTHCAGIGVAHLHLPMPVPSPLLRVFSGLTGARRAAESIVPTRSFDDVILPTVTRRGLIKRSCM